MSKRELVQKSLLLEDQIVQEVLLVVGATIYFVNQIVEYVVHNGLLKDMSVLQSSPFTDQGSVVDIFPDLSVWQGIRAVIKQINANAGVA